MRVCEEPEHVKGKEKEGFVFEGYFVIHKSQPSWEYYDMLCVINNSWNNLDKSICHAIGKKSTMKQWKHNSVIFSSVTVTVQCCCNHGDTAQERLKEDDWNEILI